MQITMLEGGGILMAITIAVVGYLMRRAIFGEIDQVKSQIKEKTSKEWCQFAMSNIEDDIREIKEITTKGNETLTQIATDVAVLKSK